MSKTHRSQELVAVSRHFSDEINLFHAEESDGSEESERKSAWRQTCVSVSPGNFNCYMRAEDM